MAEQRRVLIVDDDAQNIKVAANALNAPDLIIGFAKSGADALRRLEETEFDLILLDVMMPRMDGFQVCTKLKEDPEKSHIPVIFLTARTDEESIERAYEVGGVDYVPKPFRTRELIARVRSQLRQLELRRRLEQLATRDSLTGVYNRRRFFELGEATFSRSKAGLAAFMIDIDHFKRINDVFGHQIGDALLKKTADSIGRVLPEKAVFGRLGGEEFAALMPAKDADEARHQAEAMREEVARTVLETEDGRNISCTVSIGLGIDREAASLDGLLKIADDMLYRAKGAGRNRTMLRDS